MELRNLSYQLVAAEFGVPGPEVAAWDNEHGGGPGRLHDAAQGLVRMQADHKIVVLRHGRLEILPSHRDAIQAPAGGIDEFGLEPEALAQNPGQHSLADGDVGDITRVREAIGYEGRDHVKPCRVTMKPVTGHAIPKSSLLLQALRLPILRLTSHW